MDIGIPVRRQQQYNTTRMGIHNSLEQEFRNRQEIKYNYLRWRQQVNMGLVEFVVGGLDQHT